MSVTRGRRSRESRRSPSRRGKGSTTMDASQRQFLRKLLHVLTEVVNEKGRFVADDVEDIGSQSEAEKSTLSGNDKATDGRGKSPSRLDLGAQEKIKTGRRDNTYNVSRFKKLCENHGQLTYQIQSSLNALGGGGRTAKALERMHEEVIRVTDLFYDGNEKSDRLRIESCNEILDACRDATLEVTDAFKELGVFNKSFFDTLERITKQLEVIAVKLDVEYGAFYDCHVDSYVDSVFKPLMIEFESLLLGLTNIAEKEIAAIRLAQDFSSQRYLNLTTVATFLSSVTATTLQITANDSGSMLTSTTNTLWFVSLVFSTASAVYSLLVMTWRQSSVCQPNMSLPSLLNVWFRNGPMYTLIAAVITFSMGLCLLAFHVADQQGGFASATVPTAFAGVHAYAIFLFSAWFLLEQWKARHKESWVKVRDGYLIPLRQATATIGDKMKGYGSWTKQQLKRAAAGFKLERPKFRRSGFAGGDKKVPSDIESAQEVTPVPVTTTASEDLTEVAPRLISEQISESNHAAEPAEPEHVITTIGTALAAPESNFETDEAADDQLSEEEEDEEESKYKPFENLLEFSPGGRFLASAYSDTVTVYNVEEALSVSCTLKAPDADEVKQIMWNPRLGESEIDLLVRSSGGVSRWYIHTEQSLNAELVGHMKGTFGPVHSIAEDFNVFVSTTETIVLLFDEKCKEIRSIDISKMRKVNRIIDAVAYNSKYIFCLANLSDVQDQDCLLVVNVYADSIESTRVMSMGHISMTMSTATKRILFHGSERGVEIVELSDDGVIASAVVGFRLWWRTYGGQELGLPEEAVYFHGKGDKMFIGYSSGEIVVLYSLRNDNYLSSLHIFTTPTAEANPSKPVSFAVSTQMPYMFAFHDGRGSVTVWSIQSNKGLSNCDSAGTFEVHDQSAHDEKPITTTGQYLVLPPPVSDP